MAKHFLCNKVTCTCHCHVIIVSCGNTRNVRNMHKKIELSYLDARGVQSLLLFTVSLALYYIVCLKYLLCVCHLEVP